MSEPFRYSVALRVKHPDMDPAQIEKGLHKSANFSWKAGDPHATPTGRVLGGNRKESYCNFIFGEGDDGKLVELIDQAVGELEMRSDFLQGLGSTGAWLHLFCVWEPNGDTGVALTARLLRRLSDLGIELGINVFQERRL